METTQLLSLTWYVKLVYVKYFYYNIVQADTSMAFTKMITKRCIFIADASCTNICLDIYFLYALTGAHIFFSYCGYSKDISIGYLTD